MKKILMLLMISTLLFGKDFYISQANFKGDLDVADTLTAKLASISDSLFADTLTANVSNLGTMTGTSLSLTTLTVSDSGYVDTLTSAVMELTGATASRMLATDANKKFVSTITEANLESSVSDMTNIIQETEIDTESELEAIVTDMANIIQASEIDASSEIAGIVADETGTGALVFADSPTLSIATFTDSISVDTATVAVLEMGDNISGKILIADGNDYKASAMSGDATIASGGAVTVADDSHAHTGTTLSGIDISDDTNLSGDTEAVLTGDALSIGAGITRDTEWDTEGEVETAWGAVNVLLETEIDASSELLAIMDDETGTGSLVFGTGPTFVSIANLGTVTTADIDGGTIDGVTIGGSSAGAITGTTGTFTGNADIGGTLSLTKGSQDYLFTDRGTALSLQSQTSGTISQFDIFSKDGDGTDDVYFHIFGVGTPSDITNREQLVIQSNGTTDYQIYTEANGTGTLRPLVIYTEGNADQLKLNTDGSVDVANALTAGSIVSDGDVTVGGFTSIGNLTELTIATGAITATKGFHAVDTEADAASDDLNTINGGSVGDILILSAKSSARTVVVKDGTGNIQCAGDFSLDNTQDKIMFIYQDSTWQEVSRSDNGA